MKRQDDIKQDDVKEDPNATTSATTQVSAPAIAPVKASTAGTARNLNRANTIVGPAPGYAALAPSRRPSTTAETTGSDLTQSQMEIVLKQGALGNRVDNLETSMARFNETLQNIDQNIGQEFGQNDSRFGELERRVKQAQSDLKNFNSDIKDIREQLGVKDMNIERNIQRVTAEIITSFSKHVTDTAQANSANNNTDRVSYTAKAEEAKTLYQTKVREYLELLMARDMGKIDDSNLRTKVRSLRTRLADQLEKPQAKPASRWSALISRDEKAVAAVTRLSANPVFETKGKDDVELEVNRDVLTLMTSALYQLEQKSKKSKKSSDEPKQRAADAKNATPVKPLVAVDSFDGTVKSPAAAVNQINEEAGILNAAVLTTLHDDLAAIKKRADGLIGSQNEDWQFWGNVLKAIAVIILASLATTALMYFVGFTAPAFMLNVAATIKANVMISTVLNAVAAKLSVDLNVAAGVTVLGAATTFGVFGKLTHMVGAPSRYKQDLDRAVNAIDVALPTALSMTPRGM